MSLLLYNTYTKREEEFVPLKEGHVSMYTCGPTVYGRPHVGNYASFLMADLLRRWLEVSGHQVKHVKNITDVGHLVADADQGDDKIEAQAKAEKIDPLAIAKKYEEQYLEDERALNMLEPFARPRATETIKEMIAIIKKLLEKKNAYETDDGIYFDVTSFPHYGALSGNTLDKLDAGARVDINEAKKHPADFALWKKCIGANAHHLLRWNFSTGERVHSEGDDASSGFPGWHIECSAMSTKFLGETLDLHTGGEDNIFPHHECEIAQSECASGRPFVRMWLHRRRIDIGEQKMSKSLGNVLSLPNIVEKGFSALDLRYYLLSVHYRTNLKFSERGLDDARKARRKILEWMGEAGRLTASNAPRDPTLITFGQQFSDAMNHDLNVSEALAVLFDLSTWARKKTAWHSDDLVSLQELIGFIRHTFGCFESEESSVPSTVIELLEQRKIARTQKNFSESDRLRDEIAKRGYEVRDAGMEQVVKRL